MVYNGYYKVMSNIPKMGQLPTHVKYSLWGLIFFFSVCVFWGGGFWGVPQDLGVDAVKNVGGVLISGDFSTA